MTATVNICMPLVRMGSRGDAVKELQELLNSQSTVSPNLEPDGHFGSSTREAVRRFQNQSGLYADGIVGDCTWAALFDQEAYHIVHRVKLIPQKDDSACWLAATSMILGKSQQIQRSTVPSSLLAADGGLLNDSAVDDPTHVRDYANHFNLRMYYPTSWTVAGLASILRAGPVATHILWNVTGYTNSSGSSGHFAVIAGIHGTGTPSGTTIKILDPWPPNVGKVKWFNYAKLMNDTPALTYNLFQRK